MMKKFLTLEERKNFDLVMRVAMATLNQYGQIQADCGHAIKIGENANLEENEMGEFVVLCDKCFIKK